MSPEPPRLAETRSNVDLESVEDSCRNSLNYEHVSAHEEIMSDSTTQQESHDNSNHDQSQTALKQDQEEEESHIRNRELRPRHIRAILRLFQCRLCSKPLKQPVTLPCGRSICKTCVPETHVRTSITYPAVPDRLQGFKCPFPVCAKVHAVSDCGLDVVLKKVGEIIEKEVARGRASAAESGLSTRITVRDVWTTAGIPSLQGNESADRVVRGGRLVATWSLATEGALAVDTEVVYNDVPSSTSTSLVEALDQDAESLRRLQNTTRGEMDCQVCYALFHDPFTTGCGHTFCRPCLHRTLDHSHRCPICRRTLAINPLLKPDLCPSNEFVSRMTELFWPEEKKAREEAVASETAARHEDLDTPLFVCTLAFPAMPTFLHIFEPRYRLMIRRALEGNMIFGMVLPKRPRDQNDMPFHERGTLLRIVNSQFYPDGRSLIETVGLTRFRVVRYGELDGYVVGKTERIDDISLEEEEAIEVAEVAPRPESAHSSGSSSGLPGGSDDHTQTADAEMTDASDGFDRNMTPPQPIPITASDLQSMSTQNLMRFATEFVARMRSQSVPWLTARMLGIYGECPSDPAIFPWWFASMLPVKDLEKYRLLATSSVRERLKICCMWIVQWETTRWANLIETRLGRFTIALFSS